ncbi:protoporphyrinogen oxidase [soil metagenome]
MACISASQPVKPSIKSVAVVGGGISGLATAFFLRQAKPDWRVNVFEKEREPGGKVRTSVHGGFTFDWGPNGFLTTVPETVELAQALGLDEVLQPAADTAKFRFLYQDGGLRPLPSAPPGFVTTELLSPFEKVRAGLELFSRPTDREETVHEFVARHFGTGFADALAGAAVLGTTAGDAHELSVDALFPKLRALEQQHSSLLRGLVKQQREAKKNPKPPGRLTSFKAGGVSTLVEALRTQLGNDLKTGVTVTDLFFENGGYSLGLSSGDTIQADAVVLATPAFVSAKLLEPLSPTAAKNLATIPYADVVVFGLGYDRIDVPQPLDGFGFLVPRGEGVRSLGVLYSSSLFSSQAPAGKVFLRVICGGTLEPAFIHLSDEDALSVVRRDLRVTMGITAEPEFVTQAKWPQGIPQYLLGHHEKVAAAENALGEYPGLYLTGNAYRGVGVNDCVRDARALAARLAALPAQPYDEDI